MVAAQAQWSGTPSIKGSSEATRMALLTSSLVGLQIVWGLEMTYCTPYLLQLGLSKSKLSLVWIAGPLSGLIMQPIVGTMADKSRSRYGRRRPVMVAGALAVAALLVVLGWAAEIVGMLVSSDKMDLQKQEATVVLAVFSIYALDFAINAVQCSCRSLIIDTLPVPKQQLGSAWASRMVAVGQLVGYAVGALDLGRIFGNAFGDSQFKQVTLISATALLSAISLTSWAVTERVLISDGTMLYSSQPGDDASTSIRATLATIFHTALNLPPQIRAICHIQCFSWIGWFPFLFYSTTWVGETWLRYDAPPSARDVPDLLASIGRIGSFTLILFSIMTFVCSVSLPWLVRSPDEDKQQATGFTPRPPEALKRLLPFLPKEKPSLLTAWTAGHFLFAATIIWAPFVTSINAARLVVAASGLPWALACWAPFTFIGVEINRLPQSSLTGELAGVYLGILNLYTTLPQFVATGISTVVFAILEPGGGGGEAGEGIGQKKTGLSGIAVCLFIGAFCSAGAGWRTMRFARTNA
ncbi:hypothetical protein ANO11243_047930 [Dothideomycetidae sp. 11243]|nr:hypothetical protein ANO11243_047930 [fungal sp. No.11243]